jgi:membrane-associated HD superfamily phosphohydrolase
MALVTCPECKKEISDTAKECIHCGFSIVNEDEQKKEWGGIEGFFSTLFILSLGIASIIIAPSKGDAGTDGAIAFMTLITIATLLVIIKQKNTNIAIKTINWIIWSFFMIGFFDKILNIYFNSMYISNIFRNLLFN